VSWLGHSVVIEVDSKWIPLLSNLWVYIFGHRVVSIDSLKNLDGDLVDVGDKSIVEYNLLVRVVIFILILVPWGGVSGKTDVLTCQGSSLIRVSSVEVSFDWGKLW